MEEVKRRMLERVESPNLNKVLDLAYDNGSFSYSDLVRVNARNSGKSSAFKDIEEYCALIYSYWYNGILNLDSSAQNPEIKRAIEEIKSNPKFKTENMKSSGFYNFFNGGFDKEIGVKELAPVLMQNSIWENNQGSGGFMHVQTNRLNFNGERTNVETRLYLNLDTNSIFPFSKQLLSICMEKNLNLYTKMASNDSRNENIVIYTNYQNAGKIIDVINTIKKEQPEIFEGADKINPIMGKVDNYIGFGEEPVYKHSSFNKERSNAIEDAIQAANTKFYKETILKDESQPSIRTSSGEVLTKDDYLCYMVKNIIKQQCGENNFDFTSENLKQQIGAIKRNLIDFTPEEKITLFLKDNQNKRVSVAVDMKSVENKLCSVYGYSGSNKRIDKINFFINNILNTTNSTALRTSTNEVLSTDAYLDYLIKKASVTNLNKNINDAKSDNKFFSVYTKNHEKVNQYKNALHEITANSKIGKTYIAIARTNFKLDIEQGNQPSLNLTLPVKDASSNNDEYKSSTTLKLDFDIASKLKSVFHEKSEEVKDMLHTKDFLQPIFEKYDVCYDYPHLNASSLKSLEQDMER